MFDISIDLKRYQFYMMMFYYTTKVDQEVQIAKLSLISSTITKFSGEQQSHFQVPTSTDQRDELSASPNS